MKFIVEKPTEVYFDSSRGPVRVRVARGLEFTVDKSSGAAPIDVSGRTVSQKIYKAYFAPDEVVVKESKKKED